MSEIWSDERFATVLSEMVLNARSCDAAGAVEVWRSAYEWIEAWKARCAAEGRSLQVPEDVQQSLLQSVMGLLWRRGFAGSAEACRTLAASVGVVYKNETKPKFVPPIASVRANLLAKLSALSAELRTLDVSRLSCSEAEKITDLRRALLAAGDAVIAAKTKEADG